MSRKTNTIKNRLEEELNNISQRLRKVTTQIQESDDLEMMSALIEISKAKNNIADAKYAINKEQTLKRVGKESASEITGMKNLVFKRKKNGR